TASARMQDKLQRQIVASTPQSADRPDSEVGKVRVPPERLPRIDVRQVHLDERDLYRGEGIAQRDARVRQSARIHDDPRNSPLLAALDALDQRPFLIALEHFQSSPFSLGRRDQPPVDACQAFTPVDLGFAGTQHVEIRTVEDQDLACCPRALALPAPYLGHGRKFAVDVRTCPGLTAFYRCCALVVPTAERGPKSDEIAVEQMKAIWSK